MRNLVKKTFYRVQRRAVRLQAGLRGAWKPSRDRFVIFALHSVAASDSDMAVSPRRLREHLTALANAGYRCLTLVELLEAAELSRPLSQPSYALTFDDGYRSVYREAWPLLRELGLTATLFLTVDFLNKKIAPPWGSKHPGLVAEYVREAVHFQPLEWSEARELAGSREFEIGSHSMSHRLLARLDGNALRRELRESKSELESRLGIRVDVVSYPYGISRYGAFSDNTEAQVRESGYVASFTSEIGRAKTGMGSYLLPRIPLTDTDTAADAIAKAVGAYDWVRLAQGAFHGIFPNPHVTAG